MAAMEDSGDRSDLKSFDRRVDRRWSGGQRWWWPAAVFPKSFGGDKLSPEVSSQTPANLAANGGGSRSELVADCVKNTLEVATFFSCSGLFQQDTCDEGASTIEGPGLDCQMGVTTPSWMWRYGR